MSRRPCRLLQLTRPSGHPDLFHLDSLLGQSAGELLELYSLMNVVAPARNKEGENNGLRAPLCNLLLLLLKKTKSLASLVSLTEVRQWPTDRDRVSGLSPSLSSFPEIHFGWSCNTDFCQNTQIKVHLCVFDVPNHIYRNRNGQNKETHQ